eukprot:m.98250 g.98250  ORF g.98250 m.98250 type:complete len:138 (+) comp14862_c1_seq2:381-794(+)
MGEPESRVHRLPLPRADLPRADLPRADLPRFAGREVGIARVAPLVFADDEEVVALVDAAGIVCCWSSFFMLALCARSSGVLPSLFCVSALAPHSSNWRALAMSPRELASCSAVLPLQSWDLRSAPVSISILTICKRP